MRRARPKSRRTRPPYERSDAAAAVLPLTAAAACAVGCDMMFVQLCTTSSDQRRSGIEEEAAHSSSSSSTDQIRSVAASKQLCDSTHTHILSGTVRRVPVISGTTATNVVCCAIWGLGE
ncbi:unnamed protein product [Pylaiella littoralis]